MENSLLFEYTLSNAWGMPVSGFSIFGGDAPSVSFRVRGKGSRFEPPAYTSVALDADATARIEQLLSGLDVADIEWLEHVVVMDGYRQDFTYFSGGNEVSFSGSNIAYCKKEPDLYPNAMKMIRLLGELKALLVPLGVDRKCFSLSGK